MSRDHYLPAAFIGEFGIQRPGGRRREAKVIERTKEPDVVSQPQKAETFGYDTGLYDVQQPSVALPADYAERWWSSYEKDLPDAVEALEARDWSPKDWRAILRHIQAAWARHPDFDRDIAEQQAKHDITGLTGDCLEYTRKAALDNTATMLAAARFALLRHDTFAARFVTNDKGYTPLHDRDRAAGAVLFPMSSSIAVMMAVDTAQPGDDHQRGPHAERTVNTKGVDYFNTRLWNVLGIRSVFGHPDDRDYIAALPDAEEPKKIKIRYGPYRGNRETFLNWASDNGNGLP